MPRIVKQPTFAPPFMRRRQMVQDTQPQVGRQEQVAEPAPAPVPEPEPKAAPAPEPKRARDEDGQFAPDDPSTPEVNEAYEEGKPLWSDKMNKSELLEVAQTASESESVSKKNRKALKKLTMDDYKKDIVAALEKAGV